MALYAVDVITGEVLCKLTESASLSVTPELENEERVIGVDLAACRDMTVTITLEDAVSLITLLTGKRLTNNYLKYHGGVMQRKRHRRA